LLDGYRCLYRITWRFRFRLLEIRFPAPHADVAIVKFFATNLALAHISTPCNASFATRLYNRFRLIPAR
jgi:hypothetical protein